MPRSLLLEGILAENPEAARAQVWTFDHATVAREISRRVLRLAEQASQKLPLIDPLIDPLVGSLAGSFSQYAPSDSIRHARDDDLILPIGPPDWPAAKLGRILKHFHLAFVEAPSEAELLDLCLEAETRAVALLTRLAASDRPKNGLLTRFIRSTRPKGKIDPFQGGSVLDLSRYVLRRTFEELNDGFERKTPEEQERIAADIAHLLAELPTDLQQRIRRQAGLSDLSAAAVKQTGKIAAIGGALVGTVGITGFAAYTTVTSVIASATGLVGLTLPFAVYIHATAALALLSNPLVLGAATLMGGHFALARANRQIRDQLVPIMVATAVMASTTSETITNKSSVLVNELAQYFSIRCAADRRLRTQIDNTFQCLPKST